LLDKVKDFYRNNKTTSYIIAGACALFVLVALVSTMFSSPPSNNEAPATVSNSQTALSASVEHDSWDSESSPISVLVTFPDTSKQAIELSPDSEVFVGEEPGRYELAFDNEYYLLSDGSLVRAGTAKTANLEETEQRTVEMQLESINYAEVDEDDAKRWIESAADYIEGQGDRVKAARLQELALELLSEAHPEYKETGLLKAHFIDVGQGDSIFVELPNGRTMLIDAGPVSAGRSVVNYIKDLGYKRIDYLIATHPHEDHIGGIPTVLKSFTVGEVWAPNVSHTTQTYEDFLDAVADKSLSIHTARSGVSFDMPDRLDVEILSPINTSYTDLNDWSAIIKITFGACDFLFTGDASASTILAAENEHVDVLKVGHHGSNTSTNEALVAQLSPTYSVISCGTGNTYGHPTDAVLAALASSHVYRTDTQRTIIAECDGEKITFNKEPTSPVQAIPEPEVVAPTPVEPEPSSDYTEVYITDTGDKYHRDGCRYLRNSKIPIGLSDALARGYAPCKVCNPPT
jgi:competence protein ComEC